MFNTSMDCQLCSEVVMPSYIPTRNNDFSFSTSLLILVVYYHHPHAHEELSHLIFICISLMANDREHLLDMFVSHLPVFSYKCKFGALYFWVGYLIFMVGL